MKKFVTLTLMIGSLAVFAAGCGEETPMAPEPGGQIQSLAANNHGIPSTATIDSARVFLHVNGADSVSAMVYGVTEDWDEMTLTANSFGGGVDPAATDTFTVVDTGWADFDVTSLANAWFKGARDNSGIVLDPYSQAGFITFSSSEADSLQPFIEVCYTDDGSAECDTFPATEDTYTDAAAADDNYGSESEVYLGSDTTADTLRKAYFKYEIPTYDPPATLGDRVWHDLNQNGIQDEGEPGVEDIAVHVFECGQVDPIATTRTDADGYYVFEELEAGDYYVEIELPAGLAFTAADAGDDDALDSDVDGETGVSDCVTLAIGEENLTVDAGVIALVSIGDRVWNDVNLDGIRDANEPGMEGVTVHLFTCDDEMIAETTTGADGMYLFEMVRPGDYYVHVMVPEDYAVTIRDAGDDDALDSDFDPETAATDCLTFDPGAENLDIDAGLYLMRASVGDMVWHDMNENGLMDDGEPGLEGIAVRLYGCDGTMMAETMTDADGMYLFDELMPGEYYLEFVNPFGWIFTLQDAGSDDAMDSDVDRYRKTTVCITLEPGDDDMSWDAGLFEFEGCTYGKGYWKNHAGFGPQADVVTPLLLPLYLGDEDGDRAMEVATAQVAYDVLQQHTYGHPRNGITKLYAHLLAAKLNIVNFANPEDIHEVVAEADAFLADHDWNDWYMLSKDDQHMVLDWKDHLEMYNEGHIGPGHCDDDDNDDDDDRAYYDYDNAYGVDY